MLATHTPAPLLQTFWQNTARILSGWGWVLPALMLALLLRGITIYLFTYPTGPDYGLHLLFTRQVLETGSLPEFSANYQLGEATWPLLPGGPLIFGLVAAVSASPVFDLVHIVMIFSLIECIGTFALAQQIFKRSDAAIIATLITAILPLFVDMMTWAGYPNLIAVSLFPACFTVWLRYWEHPNGRNLALLTLVLCGAAYIHHISTLWLALAFSSFSLVMLFPKPAETLRRLLPIAIACLLVGLPILLSGVQLIQEQNAGTVLTTATRFDDTRVTWEIWARVITPMGLLLLVGGTAAFLTSQSVSRASKVLIGAYLGITLLLMFGWVIGLRFYYTRALYFLSIPIALGTAAFVLRWQNLWLRALCVVVFTLTLGISATTQAHTASRYFEIVTPDIIEAAEWLKNFSTPSDVIVTGTFLGFQLPHLLDRPQIAALTPDLISNAEILPIAADGISIMMGLSDMDAAIERRSVDFIVVRTRTPDIPDPARSRQVMTVHPRLRLVFRNSDVLIYEVR